MPRHFFFQSVIVLVPKWGPTERGDNKVITLEGSIDTLPDGTKPRSLHHFWLKWLININFPRRRFSLKRSFTMCLLNGSVWFEIQHWGKMDWSGASAFLSHAWQFFLDVWWLMLFMLLFAKIPPPSNLPWNIFSELWAAMILEMSIFCMWSWRNWLDIKGGDKVKSCSVVELVA